MSVCSKQSYMFALLVILVLSLVLAVLLGDVHSASSQVGQQVLDQNSELIGLPNHTNIKVCGFVSWKVTMVTK